MLHAIGNGDSIFFHRFILQCLQGPHWIVLTCTFYLVTCTKRIIWYTSCTGWQSSFMVNEIGYLHNCWIGVLPALRLSGRRWWSTRSDYRSTKQGNKLSNLSLHIFLTGEKMGLNPEGSDFKKMESFESCT